MSDSTFPWPIPESLSAFYENFIERLSEDDTQTLITYLRHDPQRTDEFHHTLSTSKFVQSELERRPEVLLNSIKDGSLHRSLSHDDYVDALKKCDTPDDASLDKTLRLFRAQSMVRIIWRDFNRLADFEETTNDLSYLAASCINAALDFHYNALEALYGTPRNVENKAQSLLILAMGKLGANELNLSSDIDLIFTFPENGHTDGKKQLTNVEFFSRLGKKVIQSLDAKTVDGIVFRVDMRLRPYGQSGALVYSFDAMEDYYHSQGREWERYAMVKASVIANNGDEAYSDQLMEILREFTYRKYIDFSVIDALRNLKKMITQEVKRRRLGEDVKLGAGGIREIEFTAQVFQLIRAGRDTELQDNRLLTILPLLSRLNCLPEETVNQLKEAYIFLRNTEHAIQGFNDEQTQKLPTTPEAQSALLGVMEFTQWDAFYDELQNHRGLVKSVFSELIAEPDAQEDTITDEADPYFAIWQGTCEPDDAITTFEQFRHEDPQRSLKALQALEEWASHASMHATSRERLDKFMPLLLSKLANSKSPSETLERLLPLIKSVARRSAYILLLIENPHALHTLIKLVEASPWVASTLAEHPALLDELLSPQSLYKPPQKDELQSELQRNVLRIHEDDLETQMDTLRYFRSSHALRVAASEIVDILPLMKVSDYLTWIAETILDYVLHLSWQSMVTKHGYPDGEVRSTPSFIIVGYGKLGGIELGHGSDLDLVFIHGANPNGYTDGEKSLDNQTFFMRLGQKIIHFLTTTMTSGALYEVDMRLRPSGNSGMLVSTLAAFERYQEKDAWTWEHQALVRARPVTGCPQLAEAFGQVRKDILQKPRDLASLKQDVVEMRHKMRAHLGSKDSDGEKIHLKHDAGGIVDIEFMVQYGVLAWSHSHPALVTFTDNIRILESFENSNLLAAHEVSQLTEAYKAFRTAGHRMTLQQLPSVIRNDELVTERHNVSTLWEKLLGDQATQ